MFRVRLRAYGREFTLPEGLFLKVRDPVLRKRHFYRNSSNGYKLAKRRE